MTGRIRIGIVGCGAVAATRHLPALASLDGAEVVAAADVDPERLHAVADHFRIPIRYARFEDLIADPAVDAIGVCTPPDLHVAVAAAALAAGKHVLIEKPLAVDTGDADSLVGQASVANVHIMVGFNLRWHRLVRRARTLVQSGHLGPIAFVQTTMTHGMLTYNAEDWHAQTARGGGLLHGTASHAIDLWRFLLGAEVTEIFARRRVSSSGVETITLDAQLTNGTAATAAISSGTAPENTSDIYGRTGHVSLALYRLDGLQMRSSARYPGDPRTRLAQARTTAEELLRLPFRARAENDMTASFRQEWRHFLAAIDTGRSPDCTLHDGLQVARVIAAASESIASGCSVQVKDGRDTEQARAAEIPIHE